MCFSPLTCFMPELIRGSAKQIWTIMQTTTNISILVVYGILWICVKCYSRCKLITVILKSKYFLAFSQTEKILKSITVIAGITLFGWFFASSTSLIMLNSGCSTRDVFMFQIYFAFTVNIGSVADYFIYFKFRWDIVASEIE